MFFTIHDAAKVLAESIEGISVANLAAFAMYGAGDNPNIFRPVAWTRAAITTNLEQARRKHPDPEAHSYRAIVEALEHVPDDATCATIGWFFQGFMLSESINGGMLANNNPEMQINLLCALDPSILSPSVLDMLHDDVHRFDLEDSVPSRLVQKMVEAVINREASEDMSEEIHEEMERVHRRRRPTQH